VAYCAGKLIEGVVYRFYELTMEEICQLKENGSRCLFSSKSLDDAATQSQRLKE